MKIQATNKKGPQFVEGVHKKVIYQGQEIIVPKETIAIAADGDGEIYAYQVTEPKYKTSFNEWCLTHYNSDCNEIREFVAVFEKESDAKDSLVKYKAE